MACLLQPECNFLHRYFRCKLPVEVVDVEVKIMSMQAMDIFRRDRMTQLVSCMRWTPNLCPHTNMVKKMRTFLEVENKMGPIIPAPANQYRLPLPETNPNARKGNATEKRTVTLKRKFRLVVPKATATCSPLPKSPPKPTSNAAAASMPTMVRQDTPWPSTGNMSGSMFQERNWLLPKDYLATEKKRKKWQSPT